MTLYYTLLHINRQEKLEQKRNDAIAKHHENMKKYSYRKKLKNKIKAKKSKQVELNRNS
tara:strand:+ start:1332 stop:1508 length:177 start_codon:yes stop_codon:yes gene_type:complete